MGVEGSMDGGYDFFGRAGLATVNNSERETDGAIDGDGVIEQLAAASKFHSLALETKHSNSANA